MKLRIWRQELLLAQTWTIARGSTNTFRIAIVELTDAAGNVGVGEASPIQRYGETVEIVEAFCRKVDADKLSFDDLPGSMEYLDSVASGNAAAKCALNIALLDGAAKRAQKPLHDFLGLGFRENTHVTSFSIGIAKPDEIRKKVLAAGAFPVLKLKLGALDDKKNLAALREVEPVKPVRVDANEAWTTKEGALEMIEWLARDGHVQFVEQPMPAGTPAKDLNWLKERSPLPLFADEACCGVENVAHCAEYYHGVNVKLIKAGGVSAGLETLRAARKAGLRTMIGCMIETSVLISAAAHLVALCDYIDLDGNLLITNDPYVGATADKGIVSFSRAREPFGLRVSRRA